MNIELDTNAAQVSRTLRFLFAEQLPFATSKAINDTAKDAQKAQRAGMARRFTVRRPTFVFRSIKIKPFATKHRLEARILVEPPGGQARADIITRHEERGRRRPHAGRALAVPIEARRTKTGIVGKAQRPAAFQFKRVSSRGTTEVYKGRKRTFMIRKSDGSGVILQRTGRGRSAGKRVLYILKRSVPIEPRLEFFETIRRVVRERFPENFARAFREAVRTAR